MKHALIYGTTLLGTLAVSVAQGKDMPNYNATYDANAVSSAPIASTDVPFGATIASLDERRGVPTVLWANRGSLPLAPHTTPETAARWYLERHASLYGLTRAALDASYVHRVHNIGRGGIIVMFRQQIRGVEVARTELKILMTRDLRLVAMTGNLHRVASRTTHQQIPEIDSSTENAMAGALSDLYGLKLSADSVRALPSTRNGYQHLEILPGTAAEKAGIRLVQPARAKSVYFPVGDILVPAHFVEILASRSGDTREQGYAYVMASTDGRMLYRQRLMADDVYRYRVWAEPTGMKTPLDGPQADYTPHPTSLPDGTEPAFVLPELISMEGFNTNPSGRADPWLLPDADQTLGNNVDAYADHVDPDGFTDVLDIRASTTAPGIFDHVFDTALAPLETPIQIQGAVVQLFYVTNWLHDYFYDSGFDEAAGNAQNDNYGRGGLGGDALQAEAQDRGPDPSVRNNASMFTPADGMPPRMQMFLWKVPDIARSFTITNGDGVSQSYENGIGYFGRQAFTETANLVLADDGAGTTSDGCQSLQNDVSGAIVLMRRGSCVFSLKARHAQEGGAVGAIIANNAAGEPPPEMYNSSPPLDITIPVLSITFEDGQELENALVKGPLQGRMSRTPDVERDGTIDSAIIAHEWGHLLHHRLVACETVQCLAQSEGWSDFVALHLMVREEDDYDGTFAVAIYSTLSLGENGYFGIRRAPYSRDLTKNALGFRHLTDGEPLPDSHPMRAVDSPNSEVHNAGEIWASMLFDSYLALLAETRDPLPRYTFADAQRRMADYVVAGMLLAPVDPTFTEQRDAILAAALARDPQDMMLLAQAFARRGAGTCASSPARDSQTLTGVVEDFSVRADMRLNEVSLDDSLVSCDGDDTLDAEETGMLRLTIDNPGPVSLDGTMVSVSSGTASVRFPQGATLEITEVAPFSSTPVEVPVAMTASSVAVELIEFSITISNSEACKSTITQKAFIYGNHDLALSTIDTVESPRTTWYEEVVGEGVNNVWAVVSSPIAPSDRVWHGINADSFADAVLESPPLQVSQDRDFVITFEHRHTFDASEDPFFGGIAYWDGAVLEISIDEGATWVDVSTYVDPGYGGTIADDSINFLAGRPAFVDQNSSWPGTDTVVLPFGKRLSGQQVRLRFRIGTDPQIGAHGWEIDDIGIQGIDNQPFRGFVEDSSTCASGRLPLANAGPDETVDSDMWVHLDASGSSDPDNDVLTFAWIQTSGPQVLLNGAHTDSPMFLAPIVERDTLLRFEVRVSDVSGANTDSVDITVRPKRPANDDDAGPGDAGPGDAGPGDAGPGDAGGGQGGGCNGCNIDSRSGHISWELVLLVLLALFMRRRKLPLSFSH